MLANTALAMLTALAVVTAQPSQRTASSTASTTSKTSNAALTDSLAAATAKPLTDSSRNAKADGETQVVLKRWEVLGSIAGILVTTIGGLVATLMARPARGGERRAPALFAATMPALAVGFLAFIVLATFSNRVQPSAPGLSIEAVGALARAEAKSEVSAATSRVDVLTRSVDSLQRTLADITRNVSAVTQAAASSRERLPTESYLLDGYSALTRDMRVTDRDIEGLRAQVAIAERDRFYIIGLIILLIIAESAVFVLRRMRVRPIELDASSKMDR